MTWRIGDDWGAPCLVNEAGDMRLFPVGSINFAPGQPVGMIPLPDPPPPVDRGTPHRCPICGGEGTIPGPKESTAAEVPCPTCHGERVLWSHAYPQSTTSTETSFEVTGGGGETYTATIHARSCADATPTGGAE
jgi:ribosomal protein S27E